MPWLIKKHLGGGCVQWRGAYPGGVGVSRRRWYVQGVGLFCNFGHIDVYEETVPVHTKSLLCDSVQVFLTNGLSGGSIPTGGKLFAQINLRSLRGNTKMTTLPTLRENSHMVMQ